MIPRNNIFDYRDAQSYVAKIAQYREISLWDLVTASIGQFYAIILSNISDDWAIKNSVAEITRSREMV